MIFRPGVSLAIHITSICNTKIIVVYNPIKIVMDK